MLTALLEPVVKPCISLFLYNFKMLDVFDMGCQLHTFSPMKIRSTQSILARFVNTLICKKLRQIRQPLASFLSCIKEWEFNAITSPESEVLLEAVTHPHFQLKQDQQEKEPGHYMCIHVADKEITPSLMTQYFRDRFTFPMQTLNQDCTINFLSQRF